MNKQQVIVSPGETEVVTVIPVEGLTTSYIRVNEGYYPLTIENETVSLGNVLDSLPSGSGTSLTVTSSDTSKLTATVDNSTSSMNILLRGIAESATPVTVTANYGGKTTSINVIVGKSTFVVTVKVANGQEIRGTATTLDGAVINKEIGAGSSIPLVANAIAGCSFDGWYIDNNKIAGAGSNYNYTVNRDVEIIAKFTPITYTINYNDNGGTVYSGTKTTSYTVESDKIQLPTMTRLGYTFLGWTGSNGNVPQTSVTIEKKSIGDKIYTANWAINSYPIKYDLDGGSVSSKNPMSYTINTDTITLNNPSKTGYIFAGWTGSNGNVPQTNVTIPHGSTASKNYVANYVPIRYTVVYDGNGALSGSIAKTSHTYGLSQNLSSNEFTRLGCNFLGWSTDKYAKAATYTDAQLVQNLTTVHGSTVTLFAVWKSQPGWINETLVGSGTLQVLYPTYATETYLNRIFIDGVQCSTISSEYTFSEGVHYVAIELKTDFSSASTSLFRDCSSIIYIDLSGFDTKNVTNMSNMFKNCTSLIEINIDNINTSNVTGMPDMFWGCSSLQKVDLSSFDTSKVTNMGHMFTDCSSLTEINLNNFNTANVNYFDNMFNGCTSLRKIGIMNFSETSGLLYDDMFTGVNSCTIAMDRTKCPNTYQEALKATNVVFNNNIF